MSVREALLSLGLLTCVMCCHMCKSSNGVAVVCKDKQCVEGVCVIVCVCGVPARIEDLECTNLMYNRYIEAINIRRKSDI